MIVVVAVIQASFGIYDGVLCLAVGRLSELPQRTYKTTIVWTGGSALCDIIITCSMFYYLRTARKASRVKRTNSLLTRLLKLTVETGFICAAAASMGLILFIASPKTSLYDIPALTASKLYTNCLLAMSTSVWQLDF